MDNLKYSKDYIHGKLDRKDLVENPFDQFTIWFEETIKAEIIEPNAMALATATTTGIPSVRMVLLRKFDTKGLVFFTNYDSRKGRELEENPRAAVTFYWKELERQVIIEGFIEKVLNEESEAYFNSRPRGSQIGTWTSNQGQIIPSREYLEKNFDRHEEFYKGKKVPLPAFWGGYRLIPFRFEFWQGRSNRLHDRFQYILHENKWNIERISP